MQKRFGFIALLIACLLPSVSFCADGDIYFLEKQGTSWVEKKLPDNAADFFAALGTQVVPPIPQNIYAPQLSGTAVISGSSIAVTTGTWNNLPSGYLYKWQTSTTGTSAWTPISGGTNSSQTVSTSSGYVNCGVAAVNPSGTSAYTFTGAVPVLSGTTLDIGLVSYYKLDEVSGTTRVDSSGTFNMTDNNTVGSVTGIIGNAASFDGVSEFLSCSGSNVVAGTPISVSAWIKSGTSDPSGISYEEIFDNAGQYGMQFGLQNGQPAAALNGSSGPVWYSSGVNITDANWHHLVITFDGSFNVDFYVDGSLVSTQNIGANNGPWFSTPITIGCDSRENASFWFGDIDELGIWSRALTPTEVGELYNSGAGHTLP